MCTSVAYVKLPGVSPETKNEVDAQSVPSFDISKGTVEGKNATVLKDTDCLTVFVQSRLVNEGHRTGRQKKRERQPMKRRH